MLGSIGSTELLILVFVLLVLFGGKELPKLIRILSKGWHTVQKTKNQVEDEMRDIFNENDDLTG